MMMPSSDNPVPNSTAAIVTDSGPKKSKPKVAIASASQARGFTNIWHKPKDFYIKASKNEFGLQFNQTIVQETGYELPRIFPAYLDYYSPCQPKSSCSHRESRVLFRDSHP